VHVEQPYQPQIAGTTPHTDAPHTDAPHTDAPHTDTPHNHAIPHDPILHNTHKNTEPHESAYDYFKKKLPKALPYRIKILVRVANCFAGPEDLSTFSTLDHLKDSDPEHPITQAIAIYQNFAKISDRKYPIYFADAVERCVLLSSIEGSEQTKKTAAFEQIRKQLNIKKKEVVKMDAFGRRCLTCMKRGGVASLYSINCSDSE
jgi:hypothetical protein